jgi:large subunit ribosomal protein L50
VWDSLASKGYLRPHKPYNPPEDANHRLDSIFSENLGLNHDLTNGKTKFKVLNACFKEFNHSVPNSMLHKISTKGIIFFQTCIFI